MALTVLWKAQEYFSNNHNHHYNKCMEEIDIIIFFNGRKRYSLMLNDTPVSVKTLQISSLML